MKEINLSNSLKKALVDDEDFEKLNKLKWWYQYKGYAYTSGYCKTTRKKTITLMHRLLMENPSKEVDHINRNGLDNRKENLRLATRTENNRNVRRRKDNTTGAKGVHLRKDTGKYTAYISANKKLIYLGQFSTFEEAVEARNKASIELHGSFAHLSVINET